MSSSGEAHETPLEFPAPPHVVPSGLRWALMSNPGVVFGAFFFGLGIIFTLALGTNTGIWGRLRLAWHQAEAPGWLQRVGETHYEEHDERVFRYGYTFRLPDGTLQEGTSYWPGRLQQPRPPQVAANLARPPDIAVEYCPGNPGISRMQGTRTGICAPWVLFVLIFPTIGLLATWGGIAHGRQRIRLLEQGRLAWATFTAARWVGDGESRDLDLDEWFAGKPWERPEENRPDDRARTASPTSGGAETTGETVEDETTAIMDRHRARRMALVFWLFGMMSVTVVSAWMWPLAGPLGLPIGAFLAFKLAIVTLFAWLIYWVYTSFGPLIRRRAQLAREGGTLDEFQQAQVEEHAAFQRAGRPLHAAGIGVLAFVSLFVSVWVGSLFGLIAWFVAFIIQRQRGVPLPANFQGPEFVVGVMAFVFSAALTLRALRRWGKKREQAHAAGLVPARQTEVECAFEFHLPDGRTIAAKDQYPLPMARSDVRPQIVLYDPLQPETCVRLFAIVPAVWITERGEWRADLRGCWALARLTFAAVCYTTGPLVGWLAMGAMAAP